VTAPRYPIEPLARLLGISPGTALARLGVSGSTAKQYRTEGVSGRVADRLAVRAGFHPAEVWPEWTDHQIEAAMVECAADDCADRFLPANSRHRYCSHRCQSRTAARARYARDEAGRERKRAAQRRYDAETAEYRRAQRRRRYWEDPERERELVRSRYWADPEAHRERKRLLREAS
jgi:hypothetical protein